MRGTRWKNPTDNSAFWDIRFAAEKTPCFFRSSDRRNDKLKFSGWLLRCIVRFLLCDDGGTGEVHRFSLAVAKESANWHFLSVACTHPFRFGLTNFLNWSCCCAGFAVCYSFTVDVCFFLRTSEDQLGEEGLQSLKFAKSSGTDGGLSQQSKQRSRARLHLAVSSLKGQPTENYVSIVFKRYPPLVLVRLWKVFETVLWNESRMSSSESAL